MSQRPPVVSLRGISKAFGGVQALKNIRFDANAGEVHALLGENGAGKSTLVKIITGVHQPDSGDIFLDGEPVRFADPRESRAQAIAAIYQEPNLFPDLDIAENIFVGRQPKHQGRILWPEMYKRSRSVLDDLGLGLDVRTRARNLSVAHQQMVEIARALALYARVLIMDEPTSSLTLAEVDELFAIVRRLRDSGTAIIFISHRLEDIFEVADRVTVLRDGNYISTELVADVTEDGLINKMVGRTLQSMYPDKSAEPGEVALETVGFSKPPHFHDISLSLRQGEIVGMYGLVGAGRTKIAHALFGIDPPVAGQVRVRGRPIVIRRPRDAMEEGIAFVPEDRQSQGLILPMTISSNITLPVLPRFARASWIDRAQEQRSALEMADQLDVKAASISQLARELSGGNQQRVVLSKWLLTKPSILILDEPTRGIDVGAKSGVHQLLNELASQGVAILMISSELPEILGMSDRILVIREGRLVGEFQGDEASQAKLMELVTSSDHSMSPEGPR